MRVPRSAWWSYLALGVATAVLLATQPAQAQPTTIITREALIENLYFYEVDFRDALCMANGVAPVTFTGCTDQWGIAWRITERPDPSHPGYTTASLATTSGGQCLAVDTFLSRPTPGAGVTMKPCGGPGQTWLLASEPDTGWLTIRPLAWSRLCLLADPDSLPYSGAVTLANCYAQGDNERFNFFYARNVS